MPRRPRSTGYPPRTGVVDGSSSVPTQPASTFPNQHMAMLSTSMRLCDGADAQRAMMMTRSNLKAAISSGRSKVSKVNPSQTHGFTVPSGPRCPVLHVHS